MNSAAPSLSVYEIAEILDRTPRAVDKALARIGKSPVFVTNSGRRYYPGSVVSLLRESMRRPNRKA